MASQKQIDANRANAQCSTGPKTTEDKAAASLNALKHGLTAEHAVMPDEYKDLFNETLQSFLDHLQPVGPVETLLVQQIVMASWRLTRLLTLETGLFRLRLIDEEEDINEGYESLGPETRLAHAFCHGCNSRAFFTSPARYETRVERAFYRALHELQRLQPARVQPQSPCLPVSLSPSPFKRCTNKPNFHCAISPNRPMSKSPSREIPSPPRFPSGRRGGGGPGARSGRHCRSCASLKIQTGHCRCRTRVLAVGPVLPVDLPRPIPHNGEARPVPGGR